MSNNLAAIVKASLEDARITQHVPDTATLDGIDVTELTSKTPSLHPRVIDAMHQANEAFRRSDIGIMLAGNAMQMTPEDVMSHVADIVRLPEIQALAEIARGPNVFIEQAYGDGTILKELMAEFAPRSVLIQFCATAEVVAFGGTVYTGFALDLADLNTASIYVGGSLGLGIGELTAAGQGVGLTSNAYSAVTGSCIGVDAAGAYAAGGLIDASVAISFPYVPVMLNINPSSWSVVGYFIEGIGAGVEAYGGFTLKLIDQTMPNIYQAPAAHSIDVYSIECIKRQDTSSHDEIYFYVTIDNEPAQVFRYPLWDHYSIEEDETWNIGFTVNFNSSFKLDLYESDDILHSWTVNSDSIASQGNFKTLSFSQSGVFTNDIDYNVSLYTPPLV